MAKRTTVWVEKEKAYMAVCSALDDYIGEMDKQRNNAVAMALYSLDTMIATIESGEKNG